MKFRIKDRIEIHNCLQFLADLRAEIDYLVSENKASETCTLDTEQVYRVAVAFDEMYDKLLDYELLVAGNPKKSVNIH